jgi:DnaJ-class molecular chaperone
MPDMTTDAAQTHCPGCGLHKKAVTAVIARDSGWVCTRCMAHPAPARDEPMTPARCPDCKGQGQQGTCVACNGLGVVQMRVADLKVYRPTARTVRVLTEDAPPPT